MIGKVLLIVHQGRSDPGRVGRLLMDRGFCLDVRCPSIGHVLPSSLDEYAACAMFGGPMSANDCHLPGIRRELDYFPTILDSDKPFLGICLGAQMLARVVGGKVCEHPEGLVEIGYTKVRPTEHGRRYFDGPMTVYQWHREGFELPSCATVLAEGEVFSQQAFRYGKCAYGVQFHPEVTLDMKQRWTTHGAHRLSSPGAQPAHVHIGEHEIHDPPLERWTERFLDRWLRAAEESAAHTDSPLAGVA